MNSPIGPHRSTWDMALYACRGVYIVIQMIYTPQGAYKSLVIIYYSFRVIPLGHGPMGRARAHGPKPKKGARVMIYITLVAYNKSIVLNMICP